MYYVLSYITIIQNNSMPSLFELTYTANIYFIYFFEFVQCSRISRVYFHKTVNIIRNSDIYTKYYIYIYIK